ncbi:MAG TPA: PsiF family protein [Hyphomicrobiales bacterium]|nr:PsiF family protein [Hyphomicrobiales bacterium]
MPRIAPLVALSLGLTVSTLALAQAIPQVDTQQEKQTPQQEGLQSCTTQAKNRGLNGDAERDFVAKCLTGKEGVGPAPKKVPPEQQQIVCSRQAADLHLTGGRRASFVKDCMAGNTDKKP